MMPLSWRKLALNVTRIQAEPLSNLHLADDADKIIQEGDIDPQDPTVTYAASISKDVSKEIHSDKHYPFSLFLSDLNAIAESPVYCSILSYSVRAERFLDEWVPIDIKRNAGLVQRNYST
jgi:hypothetical protein